MNPSGFREEARAHAEREASRLRGLMERVADVVAHLADGHPHLAATALLEQGAAEEELGRAGEARDWYLAAHRMGRDHGLPQAPAALRSAARAARSLGELEEAAQYYEGAAQEAADLQLHHDGVVSCTGRGNVAVDQGRWSEAERWYEDGLARLTEHEGGGGPSRERWQLLQNMGIVRRRQGRLDEAEQFLREARELANALQDQAAQLDVENGFGQLRLEEGKPRAAELHFREALRGPGTPLARIGVRANLAEALLALGRVLEAGEEARTAEAEALATGVVGRLPEIYRLLARVARERDEPEAFVFLERALALIRERKLPPFQEAQTLLLVAELRGAEGEVEVAQAAKERAEEILRELGVVPTSQATAEENHNGNGTRGES